MTDLGRLLAPRSVAIVGLSADPAKHGGRVLNNLCRLGYEGHVWGVNPKRPAVEGVEVFASLAELPEPPDAVVCAVPAPAVPEMAREAGAAGAGAMIVFAGGFAEADGRRLQEELVAAGAETGLRILGPNSGGVIVPDGRLALSFLTCLDRPTSQIRPGPVGIVTQSGGTGSYLHNLAAAAGGGLAASISTGNEVDIDVAEGIAALAGLDGVRAIGVVLETVRDGPAFTAAVEAARAAGRPVVVARIGTSERGRTLMRSHTGALARPARVLDGVLDALGVTVAETPAEMLEIAEILARAAPPAGPRVGVVTHSGGIAIMLSDLAERSSLELPAPGPALHDALEPLLQQGSSANPLDMGGIIGGPHRYGEVVDAFARSGDYDLVLAVSTAHPPAHTEARVESLLAFDPPVPVVHLWMAGDVGAHGLAALRNAGAPVTEEPRAAIKALAGLTAAARPRPESPRPADSLPIPPGPHTEHAAKRIVASWGITVVEGDTAATAAEAQEVAERIGYPVVVKVSSADIVHKTELEALRLGLSDGPAVTAAFDEVTAAARRAAPAAQLEGVLVERHVAGPEVIVGAVRDETFGPMVLVGIGGVMAEVLDDVRMAPAPVAAAHVRQMLGSLAGRRLLTEPRRGTPADLDVLADLVEALGSRVGADPSIRSVDLNPVVWSGTDWLVLDALIETD